MVTCKRSAAVVKNLTSKTKNQTEVASGLYLPCLLRGCHAIDIQSTVPIFSQVMTKNKTFLVNQSLACANYATYVAIHACIGYTKKAVKIGKVMMRRVANKLRKQDP